MTADMLDVFTRLGEEGTRFMDEQDRVHVDYFRWYGKPMDTEPTLGPVRLNKEPK